jgi:tripartite ATP-independent transporter DctP family solute receptor
MRLWLFLLLFPGAALWGQTASLILRLAEVHPADHPTTQADLEFGRRLAELSNGRLQVEVYEGGVLGDELSVIEQLQFGGIDLVRVSIASVQPFSPQLAALFMPYLYKDANHMWRVLGGPVGQELLSDLSHGGLVGIGWFEAGARSFYTTKRPVRRIADLQGLKIRVQESPPMIALARTLGSQAVPLTFSAVYPGLRTGELEGAENNLPTYFASSHYKAAAYFTMDEHARLPELIIGSPVTFAEITPEDQALIRRAAADAAVFQRAAWAEYEAQILNKLKAAGVVFLQPADLGAWRQKAREIWSQQTPEVRALLGRIQNTP